jgi:hypothetical protein
MSEAKRRRALECSLKQIQLEGQGVFQFTLITPLSAIGLMSNALTGDAAAARVMLAFAEFLKRVVKTYPPTLCLLCDTEFVPGVMPATGVLLTAHRDEPEMGIWNGLCLECSQKSELETLICAYYRQNAISDLRRLPPFAADRGGHQDH